jgi:hypothetical protein
MVDLDTLDTDTRLSGGAAGAANEVVVPMTTNNARRPA